PRQTPRVSNGCLLAIVVLLAVIALAICLVGAWVGWMVLSQGATVPFFDGPAAMSTARPDAGVTESATAPGSAQISPTTKAIIEARATFTQTAELKDEVVGAAIYAPDGSLVAVGLGGAVELRDGASLEPRQRLEGHTGEISALAFTPDSATLASGAQDDTVIRLWDVRSARELRRLEGHTGWIRSLAVSPDGAVLASGSTDNTVILWDIASGRQLRRLEGHTDFLGNLAFSPDGATLASVSRDGTVRLWDVASGGQREEFRYTAPVDPQTSKPFWLTGVSYSPDGRSLAVGSVSGSVYILDASNGKLDRELKGHQGWVVIRGVSYSPDGNLIASASLDGTVRLWSPRTGVERGVLQVGLRLLGLSWNPDGSTLAVSSDTSGSLAIWDVTRRELTKSVILAQGAVTALSYADSGEALASGGVNGLVKIHLLADGRAIPLSGGAPTSQYLAFLSDTQLVAASDGGDVMVLTVAGPAQEERRQLEGLDGLALTVDVSRDRRLIAAGNDQGDIAIWDARSLAVQRTLSGLGGPVYGLAFNRDGSQIAGVTNQPAERPKVIIWDVTSGNRLTTFSGHQGPITAIEMPAGGDMVASASSDGSLKLWKAGSGDEVRSMTPPAEQGWYNSLAFSPDGALMVTGTLAGQVDFWNATSGERLSGVDLGLAGSILGLSFRPDGGQLAVATRDGGVVLLEPTR
ncbi:MAG: WD40 repeat domain-containing protein, partial [Chloroflexales bacterium]|nr:WD40 repeat domain-containing protein [Chloroflexales bacterium]